jgi:hypothetical protein
MSVDDPKFKAQLSKITKAAAEFYDKLEVWIEQDNGPDPFDVLTNGEYDSEKSKAWIQRHHTKKIATIKKYVSSTHVWIKGKQRWSSKLDNWLESPFECKVCQIGGAGYEKLDEYGRDYIKIDLEAGNIPTGCMHGNDLQRTCEEVQQARIEYRKRRKGTKCYQCGTYGCLWQHI